MATPTIWRLRTKIKRLLAGLLVCLLGWVCVGKFACFIARRYVSNGRLTRAANFIPWCQRLCPWDTSLDLLAAVSARRRGDRKAWASLIARCASRSPNAKELKFERELMQVQSGTLDANSQSQVKRMIIAGADPGNIAEAFVLGYMAHHDADQVNVVLTWWESLNLRPSDAKLYRGIVARTRGEFDLAKNEYRSVLKECPCHELAQIHLADLLLETGSIADALKYFLSVFREAPQSVAAQVGVARCLRQLGKWNAAEALLNPLLNQPDPADGVVQECGQLALEKGDYTFAETYFARASQSRAATSDSRTARATALALQGRPAEGILLMQRDDRTESLRKRQRDLQVRSMFESEDASIRHALQNVSDELIRAGT
jgi:Tfp pilus assembly protein PilF